MSISNLSASQPIIIRLFRIDNRIVINSDGETILDRTEDFDPSLNIPIEIANKAPGNSTKVRIEIHNTPATNRRQNNPWHLAFKIEGANQAVSVDVSGPHSDAGLKEAFEYMISWN